VEGGEQGAGDVFKKLQRLFQLALRGRGSAQPITLELTRGS